jgi:hypothetical protein
MGFPVVTLLWSIVRLHFGGISLFSLFAALSFTAVLLSKSRFAMLAVVMMFASASGVVTNPHEGVCDMTCCLGTWAGDSCTVDTASTINVRHSGQASFHRCYQDVHHGTNGCVCQCADAADDFTDANMYNTPEVVAADICATTTPTMTISGVDTLHLARSTSPSGAQYSCGIPGQCMGAYLCPAGVSSCNNLANPGGFDTFDLAKAACDANSACYGIWNKQYPVDTRSSHVNWNNLTLWQMHKVPTSSAPTISAYNPAQMTGGVLTPGCNFYQGFSYLKDNGVYDLMGYGTI